METEFQHPVTHTMAEGSSTLIVTLFAAVAGTVPLAGEACVLVADGYRAQGRLARLDRELDSAGGPEAGYQPRLQRTAVRRSHWSELLSIEVELAASDVAGLMPHGRSHSVEVWNAASWQTESAGTAAFGAGAARPFAAGLAVAVRAKNTGGWSKHQPAPRGLTLWLTGLSGAGKTSIATALERELERHARVELLDADVVRTHLCKGLGFSEEDRGENVRRLAVTASLLAESGAIVVVSAISPYRAVRDAARQLIGRFMEVYVNAPLSVCEGRDVKGLYERARRGEIRSFTGIDDPYEPPLDPEIECRTDLETISESVAKILKAVAREGTLQTESAGSATWDSQGGAVYGG